MPRVAITEPRGTVTKMSRGEGLTYQFLRAAAGDAPTVGANGDVATPPKIPPRLLAASFLQPDYLVPLLERQRLIASLDGALRCRLIEIRAPTGCGKTTLLFQWRRHLSGRGIIAAWLDILRPDLDASDFLASIGWALHIAGVTGVPRDLLDADHDRIDSTRSLVELLAQIAGTEVPVVLLIDDFHLLRDSAPLALIDTLLAAAPPNLHVAIGTRSPPGLSIGRLQTRGLTHTVSTEELLFSSDEARALLLNDMSPADAAILMAQTAGWPIAVQLARLWFRQLHNRDRNLLRFPEQIGNVATYLTNQVVSSLAEELRSFLIDTSILSRITSGLADAIRARSDSRLLLQRLKTFAPLLMPIADAPDVYKLHPLLAEQLRERLREHDEARYTKLHRAAAEALARCGQLLDAVRHAKVIGDPDLPNALIAARAPVTECLLRGPGEIRSCLTLLHDREWERNPHVWLARLFIFWRDGRFADAEKEFVQLRARFGTGGPDYTRDVVILRVVLSRCEPAYFDRVLEDCDRELTAAGAHNELMRALLNTGLGISKLQVGELSVAERAFQEAFSFYEPSVAPVFGLYKRLHLGWIAAVRGDLEAAYALLHNVCRAAKRFGSAERNVRILARAYMLGIEYETCKVTLAATEINAFLDEIERASVWYDFFVTAYKVAIEIAFQREGSAAALAVVARGRAAIVNLALEESAERTLTMFEASVLARSGDPMSALIRVADFSHPDRLTKTWYEFDALMFANGAAFLAQGRNDDALELSRRWLERGQREGRKAAICRGALIASVALWRRSERDLAIEGLQRSLRLAAGERMIAPCLEHDIEVRLEIDAMLDAANARSAGGDDEFTAEVRLMLVRKPSTKHLVGRLSAREREVLDALCGQESNKHIGRRLGVSEDAVKFHVKNIFRKLGVHSRQEAIKAVSGGT
jgi:LuxR family transcriptional regulator, maltose regulon positive regulatory protein